MDTLRPFLLVTLALFVLLTLAHVWRAITGTVVHIGATEIAAVASWPFAVLTAALALWAARLVRAHPRP